MGKLTDLQIKTWIKKGERFEGKADGEGLYLRYRHDYSTPMWRFRYKFAGKPRWLEMGSYRTLSLAEARKLAKEMKARVALGHDVAMEKKERKQEAVEKIEAVKKIVTVAALADEYFEARILGRWKHPNIVRSRIDKDIKPAIGKLSLAEVRPGHVDTMLKSIVARGAPTMATDVMRWGKRMFDYAIKRELVDKNPFAVFDPSDAGGTEKARERWLTRDELAQLLKAIKGHPPGWAIENGSVVKLLLMLAVRKQELIAARIEEFDLVNAVWHLPAERTKTEAAIDIPLPSQAVVLLEQLVSFAGHSAWLLPARKMQSRMIPHIDLNTVNSALGKHIRPMLNGMEPFTLHDFRRTARTHLESLGVAPHIAERCLNHKLKGVQGIYNRHDYFEERKAALQSWADLLASLEAGGNVVPIAEKRKANR